jgi:hypothetical protein
MLSHQSNLNFKEIFNRGKTRDNFIEINQKKRNSLILYVLKSDAKNQQNISIVEIEYSL